MFAELDPTITAALVAAVVSIGGAVLTTLWLDRRAHREDLEADYRQEQRKALQQLIGRYHGGLLDYATSWNYRMQNLYTSVGNGWQDVQGDYGSGDYYFHSTVYRSLALLGLAQQFEREQVFIDARFVEPRELEFVKFVKAFHWAMSDAALFGRIPYDRGRATDHFVTDRLRALCEAFLDESGVPSFRQYEARVRNEEGRAELQRAFRFFDGVSPTESRLRWDRLVCLHLLTEAFVTTFGYEWQRPERESLSHAVDQFRNPQILDNFIAWLPRLGLDEQECLLTVKELAGEHRERAQVPIRNGVDLTEIAPPPAL